jgi:lipoyl(octanoyl) transferase
MNIEIKKSIKPINYFDAINLLENRLENLYNNIDKELIWTLEHNEIFTAGTSFKDSEILDNSIELIKTNRGGKITCHAPGQLICYFVLDLRKKKDIRKFISCIEKTIIETLKEYKIETFSDKDNIGIWHKKNNSINKVAAIGVRVKKWIAYHGFAINVNNNLEQYKKIIPCGITDKGVTNLINISNNDYSDLDKFINRKIYFKPENLSLFVFNNFLK